MAKINNFKDTEGIEKEREFLNCNKTMAEYFSWSTSSTQQLSAQQATYALGKELREHDTAYFKVTDGLKTYYEGHNCWAWFLEQPATFIVALLQEREILNFKMLDGIINIEKIDDFYMVQKFENQGDNK